MAGCRPLRVSAWQVVALVVLILAGCGDSEQPLSDPQKSIIDKRHIGAWQDGSGSYIFVGRPDAKAALDGIFEARIGRLIRGKVEIPEKGLHFIQTRIGEEQFLSVFMHLPDGASTERLDLGRYCVLLKYRVEGDTLTIWTMDTKAKAALIESGKLKGKVGKWFGSTYFTDSTDNIRHFIEKEGSKVLFPDSDNKGTLTRIRN